MALHMALYLYGSLMGFLAKAPSCNYCWKTSVALQICVNCIMCWVHSIFFSITSHTICLHKNDISPQRTCEGQGVSNLPPLVLSSITELVLMCCHGHRFDVLPWTQSDFDVLPWTQI